MELVEHLRLGMEESARFIERLDSIMPDIQDDNLKRLVEDLFSSFKRNHQELEKAIPVTLRDVEDRLGTNERETAEIQKSLVEANAQVDALEADAKAVPAPAAAREPIARATPPTPYVIPTGVQLCSEVLARFAPEAALKSPEPVAGFQSWAFDDSVAQLSTQLAAPTAAEVEQMSKSEQALSWNTWLEQSGGDSSTSGSSPSESTKKRDWGKLF